jgi:hypothetical protein
MLPSELLDENGQPSEHTFEFSINRKRENRFYWPTKGSGCLQHHIFLIFDGKQHLKKIWFRGC